MPSSPVHLRLAQLMAEELGIKNKPDFMLGAIAPDCVNYGLEQASEEVRYKAHVRSRDYEVWKTMLRDFYEENKERYGDCPDFLRGYLFHIWADIAWDETVQPMLFDFLGTLGYGYDDMTAQKWQELYRFNSLVVNAPYFEECRELVRAGTPRDIAGCSAGLIKDYSLYVADDYRDKIKDEAPLFLSEEHILITAEHIRRKGYFA